MSALIAHYNTPFWIPAGTNKDDLDEWPWMADST